MIPFPFNENWFSFFVADHQLVGQLCTNPKSDRRLLSCLKVTQCSTSEKEETPAVQRTLSTDSTYDNRAIASTLKMQIWIATNNRDVPRVMTTKFPATVMVFGVVSSESPIMPPHIFEVGLKVNTKVYLDVLKSVMIPWCNQVASGRPWVWQQDPALAHNSKETQAWLQKECYDLYPSLTDPLLPRPEPAGVLRLVIRWEHHQHDLPQHQSQPDRRYPPSIRRASTELPPALVEKACFQFRIRIKAVIEAEGGYIEKMSALLHNQVTWIDFFNKSFKIKL